MSCLRLIPVLLGILFLPLHAVCEEDDPSDSGAYQWVDDNGTVHFTDNSMNIPQKKMNKVRRRASLKGSVSPSSPPHESSSAGATIRLKPMMYGGHDENWWRGRFAGLGAQIQKIKDAIPEKEARLRELHFKKVASNAVGMSAGVSGNPRQNKTAYLSLHAEIKADEERMASLEKELEDLKREASSFGVPQAWQ